MCTAAILAGGRARRLDGLDKSALVVGGLRIIDRQLQVLRQVAGTVVIVANDVERYRPLGLPVMPDLVPGAGALGGIYSALMASETLQTLVVACDMPFLSAPFLSHVLSLGRSWDVVMPRTRDGYQPLAASYARACAAAIRRRIDARRLQVTGLLPDVRAYEMGPEEIRPFDPYNRLFFNVNTARDYARAADLSRLGEG